MLTRAEAVEALREAAESWLSTVEDSEESLLYSVFEEVYLEESTQLRLIADLLEENADKAAWAKVCSLSTVVRECLSKEIWEFLEFELDENNVSDE